MLERQAVTMLAEQFSLVLSKLNNLTALRDDVTDSRLVAAEDSVKMLNIDYKTLEDNYNTLHNDVSGLKDIINNIASGDNLLISVDAALTSLQVQQQQLESEEVKALVLHFKKLASQ